MGESRALAAVARQAGVAEGQLAELRRELLEEVLEEAMAAVTQAHNKQGERHRGGWLPERGEEEEEGAMAFKGGVEGLGVRALAAALQRAEAARAREQAEARAAVGALRRGLGAVGERAVEAARVQVSVCLCDTENPTGQ